MNIAKPGATADALLSRVEFGAHEETVDHINRKIFRSWRGHGPGELPPEIFKLRYQVYCLECAFLESDQYSDEMEFDDYDPASTHFAAYTMDETMVGTVRLVQPEYPQRYPFELHCTTFDEFEMPPRRQAAEISRLAVKKSHRRRRADRVLGIPGVLPGQDDPIALAPEQDRRDRVSPMLLLGMYREMYRYSREAGIRYWFAAMERSLAHALRKMGFRFNPIGPQCDYYGAVIPYMVDLDDLEHKLRCSNPALAAWFHEKPPLLVHSRQPRLRVVRKDDLGADID